MAKGISSGIQQSMNNNGKNKEVISQINLLEKQWKEFRNKIDSILISNNIMKNSEVRLNCLKLDTMTHQERMDHIQNSWGPMYLDKVMPLLLQLVTLENQIANAASN